MSRILHILSLLLLTLTIRAGIHTYTESSVLSSGTWIKLSVDQSGVYRMSYEDLKAAGLSHPEQVRIYGYGGAMLTQAFSKPHIDDLPSVGFYMNKGKDGIFGAGDFILFYAQGPVDWTYGGQYYTHQVNPYSQYGYYFISDNAGVQNIMPFEQVIDTVGATKVNTYWDCQVHEKDLVNLIDYQSGEEGGGREFYGESFSSTSGSQQTFSFSIPNAISTENSYVHIAAGVRTTNTASTFRIELNKQTSVLRIDGIALTDNMTKASIGQSTFAFPTSTTEDAKIKLTFSNSSSSAVGYLNYIELMTPCSLRVNGAETHIFTSEGYKSSSNLLYQLDDAAQETEVWNITHLDSITRVPASLDGTRLSFGGNNMTEMQEYIVVNPTAGMFRSPKVVGTIGNQNLHQLKNIDYVIICPEAFRSMATELAKKHEEIQSITWAVVTDQEVYNEFSSGTPDATAYRWLMKMLYDRANNSNERPRWLLLMGDGTFDNRKILSHSGTNTLLTYQAVNSSSETLAYATDDYFGWLNDNEGESDMTAQMDIAVGRFPVNTTEEAQNVVDKTIAYLDNNQPGKWKQQLLFLADDGDHGQHTITAEAGAERVRLRNPDFIVNKIYLDAYPQEVNASGESYPYAKNRLHNLLSNGVLYLNYSGHGGYNNITNESILGLKDIQQMSNSNLAFWMFATCNFAHFDAGKTSAAEEAILNPHGGAIGVLSACRTVYATQNTTLNRNFCDTLFGHQNTFSYNMTIGEATACAKNRTGNDANKLAYILLGDPAIQLHYPNTYYVQTTSTADTLHALDVSTIDGEVVDQNQQVATWFNGTVDITIFDKIQQTSTLDNDAAEGEKKLLTFNDYPNTLISGSANVIDGKFSYTFMLPKDIRYNYGKGRIAYYVYDSIGTDGFGSYNDFIVGGSGSLYYKDSIGPTIRLYLNTPSFSNGGTTYESPRFFAEIYDESGINTVGSGIGHDLMLTIDNKTTMAYSLNEYFTAANNSYQQGIVSYRLNELEDGPHTLSFKAWDLLNNSTTEHLNFTVKHGIKPNIYSVVAYPNPVAASGTVHLLVQYDQPDVAMTATYYLYDINGQLVWTYTGSNPDNVQINLAQLGLKTGIYLYAIRIQVNNGPVTTTSGKIVVTK